MDNKELDKILKDKLKNAPTPPPVDLWSKIEGSIPVVKKKRIFPFWIIATAVVITAGFIWYGSENWINENATNAIDLTQLKNSKNEEGIRDTKSALETNENTLINQDPGISEPQEALKARNFTLEKKKYDKSNLSENRLLKIEEEKKNIMDLGSKLSVDRRDNLNQDENESQEGLKNRSFTLENKKNKSKFSDNRILNVEQERRSLADSDSKLLNNRKVNKEKFTPLVPIEDNFERNPESIRPSKSDSKNNVATTDITNEGDKSTKIDSDRKKHKSSSISKEADWQSELNEVIRSKDSKKRKELLSQRNRFWIDLLSIDHGDRFMRTNYFLPKQILAYSQIGSPPKKRNSNGTSWQLDLFYAIGNGVNVELNDSSISHVVKKTSNFGFDILRKNSSGLTFGSGLHLLNQEEVYSNEYANEFFERYTYLFDSIMLLDSLGGPLTTNFGDTLFTVYVSDSIGQYISSTGGESKREKYSITTIPIHIGYTGNFNFLKNKLSIYSGASFGVNFLSKGIEYIGSDSSSLLKSQSLSLSHKSTFFTLGANVKFIYSLHPRIGLIVGGYYQTTLGSLSNAVIRRKMKNKGVQIGLRFTF